MGAVGIVLDDVALARQERSPFSPSDRVSAYYAPAELACFRTLGWECPVEVIDLYAEFVAATNGRPTPAGRGLLGALVAHGIPGMSTEAKDRGREIAIRGGPRNQSERSELTAYCTEDVRLTSELFAKMAPHLDGGRALLRGRYAKAVARMEEIGIPIDVEGIERLRDRAPAIRGRLIEQVDRAQIYDGETFVAARWEQFVAARRIDWPRAIDGRLLLDDKTFAWCGAANAEVDRYRSLRKTLAQLRRVELGVGSDGRHRCMLSPFGTKTGRNAPSTSKFIFGVSSWARGFVRPAPGNAIAYIDWAQQEFGIAAALSGDLAMLEAYTDGDPYLRFAKLAGAVPADATKATHPELRQRFKSCVLAVQYGQSEHGLAVTAGISRAEARELLRHHRRVFGRFWHWVESAVDYAQLTGRIHSVFGWPLHVDAPAVDPDPRAGWKADAKLARTLLNFPMQSNGAEMLRFATIFATEAGVRVCAPVHDALLIEAAEDEIDAAVEETQRAMARASQVVLGGFELRTDARIVRYPDRLLPENGPEMWGSSTVRLTPQFVRRFGVNRFVLYRALEALECSRLCTVHRRRGAAAHVTLVREVSPHTRSNAPIEQVRA